MAKRSHSHKSLTQSQVHYKRSYVLYPQGNSQQACKELGRKNYVTLMWVPGRTSVGRYYPRPILLSKISIIFIQKHNNSLNYT